MLPIYVDFDDVLCESTNAYVKIFEREFNKKVYFENISSFDLKKAFGLTNSEFEYFFSIVHRHEEVLSFELIEGAIEVLTAWANKGYEISIVTGRLTSSYEASIEWLSRHKVPYRSFTMVDKYSRENFDKNIAISMGELSQKKFCLAIEDSVKMARHLSLKMEIQVALFDRPWNRLVNLNGKITRYKTWAHMGKEFTNP